MKAQQSNYAYAPKTLEFETHDEYRDFIVMLHYISGNSINYKHTADSILEVLNGIKKD